MIYFNQASTSYPKPDTVIQAVGESLTFPPFSQYRSSRKNGSNPIRECKKALAQLFGIRCPERVFLTSGATDSMNKVIAGLKLCEKKVLITQMEHNALLRPLYNTMSKERIGVVRCDASGALLMESLIEQLQAGPEVVFVNHCSNVTGAVNPLREISEAVHAAGAILVVDASQSAGCIPIDVEAMGIDLLVFTGHKGLYGPQGTGGFYVSEALHLKSNYYGGTGRESKTILMPPDYEEYEVGTQNLPGICGLLAGVRFVLETGVAAIADKERALITYAKEELCRMKHVKVYGPENPMAPLLSFTVQGLKPQDIAYILSNSYEIIVRSGFHCAPLIHEAIGTSQDGTVRISVSYWNEKEEVTMFLHAMRELVAGL